MVNEMKALGETIGEPSLVQKILKSLPDRFNPKVSAIEELNDLKTFIWVKTSPSCLVSQTGYISQRQRVQERYS